MALTAAQRRAYRTIMDFLDYVRSANVVGFRGKTREQEATFQQLLSDLGIGGGGAALDIEALTEKTEQGFDDEFVIRDPDADAQRKIKLQNLGIYVRPTANGHTPDLQDAAVAQAYVDLNLPCIVASQILYARRELAGGHSARAVWAPIESDPSDSDVGDEIVTAAAVGQVIQEGDRRSRTVSGTTSYYVANRDFTILTGDVADGLPGETAATGWDDSTQLSFAGFRGVVTDPGQVGSPADGEWVYDVLEGIAYGSRYTAGDMVWHGFTPGADEGINNLLGVFANTTEALEEVHFFSTSQTTVAIIDGQLHVLTFWDPPDAGDVEYHWRSRGAKATAPLLVATDAADSTRTANEWETIGSDVYQTLLELGAQWVHIEIAVATPAQLITFPPVRVGALRETDDDLYVNGVAIAGTVLGSTETGTSAMRGALSYDGDDLQIRLNNGTAIDGTISVYAIR